MTPTDITRLAERARDRYQAARGISGSAWHELSDAAGGMAPLTDPELADIARGIDAAKVAIPYLDVRSLAEQHRLVLRRTAKERAAA